MNRPLLVAVLGALLGFGGWIWLTGPGTSVPNALVALLCAILCGRGAWWLVARDVPDEDTPPDPPQPKGRRAPPPADAESWRKPDRRP